MSALSFVMSTFKREVAVNNQTALKSDCKRRHTQKAKGRLGFLSMPANATKLLSSLALASTLGLAGCQGSDADSVFDKNDKATHTELSQGAVVVDFERVNQHILVPVSINGSKPLKFVLDTGAPITAIIETANTQGLPLQLGQEIAVAGAGKGRTAKANLVPKTRATIAGSHIDNLMALWLPFGTVPHINQPDDAYFDGIIGRDLLNRYSVEIDFNTMKLALHPAGTSPTKTATGNTAVDNAWQPLALSFSEDKHPYVETTVSLSDQAPLPVKLILDTGSTGGLTLSPKTHDSIVWPKRFYHVEKRGLSGKEVINMAPVPKLTVASYAMTDFIGGFSDGWDDAGSQGMLGNRVLNRFNLWFDYKNSQLWVQPHQGLTTSTQPDAAGLKLLPRHKSGAKVVVVYANGAASKLNIKEGDIVTRIAGEQVTASNFDQLMNHLYFTPNAPNRSLEICWQPQAEAKAHTCEQLTLHSRL